MTHLIYDQTARHDEALKATIKAQVEHRQAVFAQAKALVDEAAALMTGLGNCDDNPLVERNVRAIRITAHSMNRDARLVMVPPTDAYLGNMAARSRATVVRDDKITP